MFTNSLTLSTSGLGRYVLSVETPVRIRLGLPIYSPECPKAGDDASKALCVEFDSLRDCQMQYYCDDQRHLMCQPYSIENLHAMAEALNIKRCWYHYSRYPHYDIPKRRIAEVTAKCVKVSCKDLLAMIKAGLAEMD